MSTQYPHVEPKFDAGMGDQITIGLITLSTDVVTEWEMSKMLPSDGVTISSTRIKTHNPMTVEHLEGHAFEIAKAASLYDPPDSIDVFAYACTSGSAIISQEKLEGELHRSIPGAKLTSPMTGALRAFRTLAVKRVAMLTPYPDDVTAAMIACLTTEGIDVAHAASFHIVDDFDVIRITPSCIVEAACLADVAAADAFFIPCTGFRTSGIISDLETRLRKPVVTAHQAMLWDAMRLGGFDAQLEGYGALLMK
jgi:maleate isomerase